MRFEIDSFEAMDRALKALVLLLEQQNIDENVVFDSRLVSCELLSNVLQHTAGRAFFTPVVKDGFVELQIDGEIPFVPPETSTCAEVYAESGRGLFLVDAFCDRRIATDRGVKVYIKLSKQ